MIDFKFEVGKFYKRRDGIKVECVKINCKGQSEILLYGEGYSSGFSFYVTKLGKYYNSNALESEADIVGIWEEPKPKRLCYRGIESGTLKMFTSDELEKYGCNYALERFPCCLDEV